MNEGLQILPLSSEQNFMHNRDLDAYAHHQAESCIWLYRQLGGYIQDDGFEPYKGVLYHLQRVHTNQLQLLVSDGMHDLGLPEGSFYFQSLFDKVGTEPEAVLWVHCISYFRGYQRYIQLSETTTGFWCILARDAMMNGNLLLSVLSADGREDLRHIAIGAETELIAEIDKRNGEKAEA